MRLQAALHYMILSNRMIPLGNRPRDLARTIAVRRNTRRALILTVLNTDLPAVDADDPAVIVYVLDPEHDVRKMLAPVYRLYQLTDVESRLSSELVSGASLGEAAAAISVRPHTARGYLKQIFAKTQTNRQADLIRLLLASAARNGAGGDLSLM
jgi:DNA-binding CsgD family transcriptional regulator